MIEEAFVVKGSLHAFDAALAGGSVGESHASRLREAHEAELRVAIGLPRASVDTRRVTASRACLRLLVDLEQAARPRDVMKALTALGKTQPAIGAVLLEHQATTKPIPKLSLADREEPRTAAALDELACAQLEEANHRRYGGQRLTAQQIFEGDEDAEERVVPSFLERWRVLSGKKHLYDAWLYMSDSGSVFKQGRTDVVAEIIQGGVESEDALLNQALSRAIAARSQLPKKRATKKKATKATKP